MNTILIGGALFLFTIFTLDCFAAPVVSKLPSAIPQAPLSKVDKVTGIEVLFIKGGCFQMGDTFGDGEKDERPVREVCVDDFYLGNYEVTQAQWQKVMGDNPSESKECGKECPVEQVSWEMVQNYIKKINALTKLKYRLPTEAEWEYAARSGGKPEKWAGTNDESELENFAWYGKNSGNVIHKVGQKKPNSLGLYDMSGNVREWCQDWYDAEYYAAGTKNNPVVSAIKAGDSRKVLRGGDLEGDARKARNSTRNANEAGHQTILYGFRLLLPVK